MATDSRIRPGPQVKAMVTGPKPYEQSELGNRYTEGRRPGDRAPADTQIN